jgi:hypothetical protein
VQIKITREIINLNKKGKTMKKLICFLMMVKTLSLATGATASELITVTSSNQSSQYAIHTSEMNDVKLASVSGGLEVFCNVIATALFVFGAAVYAVLVPVYLYVQNHLIKISLWIGNSYMLPI